MSTTERRRRRKTGGGSETDSLLSTSSARQQHDTTDLAGGLILNRILILVLLVVLVFVGIAFQTEVNHLTLQLESEQSKTSELENILTANAEVIKRFNSSVTNTDVMKRLTTLEGNLSSTTLALQQSLSDVQERVQNKLDATVKELSRTVTQAEDEISQEVERVKKDVEQYVITTQDQFSMENSFMVYQLAGTFTLLSCLISMWHMTAHLRKMLQPEVQRKILAILWMCPIYAVTSWFSLVFHSAEGM